MLVCATSYVATFIVGLSLGAFVVLLAFSLVLMNKGD